MARLPSRRAGFAARVALALATLAAAGAYHRATSDPVYDEPRSLRPVSFDAVARARGARLPLADRAGPLPGDELPLVTVTRTALLVGNTSVTEVPNGERVASPQGFRGFDRYKAGLGHPGSALLSPLLSMLEASKRVPRAKEAGPGDDDRIRLAIDPETPYQAAAEVLFTAARAGFSGWELMVATPERPGAVALSRLSSGSLDGRTSLCVVAVVEALVTPEGLELRSWWPCPPGNTPASAVDPPYLSANVAVSSGRLARPEIVAKTRVLYPPHPDLSVPLVHVAALPHTPWQLVIDAVAALSAAGAKGELDLADERLSSTEGAPAVRLGPVASSTEAWRSSHQEPLTPEAVRAHARDAALIELTRMVAAAEARLK